MTTLVLGTVGGIVGNMIAPGIGGSIGFLVGSMLGNLIDPPKVEGPRRSDLKLQRSEYGTMFPFVWGVGRVAGNVIDQTDLEEHKEVSGGKGGPEVTTYTYSASYLISLAASKRFGEQAILGVLRIWADSRLIWSASSGEDAPCVFYLGTEDQEPDPTFEAINGVGQQPAYRGLAYAAFTDQFLTDFGDRIPLYEFEVFTALGDYPYRVAHFDPIDGQTGGYGTVEYANGVVTVGFYKTASMANGVYYEWQYDLEGNLVAGSEYSAEVYLPGFPKGVFGLTAGTDGTTWWYKENSVTTITANPFGGAVLYTGCGEAQAVVYHRAGYIYATGRGTLSGDIGIVRYPAPGGTITDATGTYDAYIVTSNVGSGDSLSNWVVGRTNVADRVYVYSGLTPETLYEYDLELTGVVRQWDMSAAYDEVQIVNGDSFTVYRSPLTGKLIFACDRGVGFSKSAAAFELADNLTVTYIGQVDAEDGYTGNVVELGNSGFALVDDGIIQLDPPGAPAPLATIVADLSSMTPLAGEGSPENDAFDVSELTDLVRWYAVGTQATVRNALDPLRRAFIFGAVEADYRVVFKKYGATDSVVTIPDTDLVARDYGTEPGDPLVTNRKREQGMPRNVTLRYIDVEMDYQTGAKNSPRLTTLSDSDVTLDLPIGFTANEALQKAWAIQLAEWVERETFEWSTTREYSWVVPCDVVTVRGRVIRVIDRTETPRGVLQWVGVQHRPSVYTQEQVAGNSTGFSQPTVPVAAVSTQLVLLDIPVLSQDDAPFGFYAAMGPSRDGPWPGAALYKSVDGGTTYTAVASAVSPAVIGLTADSADILGSPAYGSPSVSGALSAYSGGDVVEEASIVVVLTDDDAELTSINASGLANGENLCAVSRGVGGSPPTTQWELLQFRDALLVADKTYVLTGFLRGRKDTPTDGHGNGDRFVLLPVTNVDAPQSDLNKSLLYKAVTFGLSLADTTAQTFINTGVATTEFYETEAGQLPVYPVINPSGSGSPAVLYNVVVEDNGRLLVVNEPGGLTLSLPEGMRAGWYCWVENVGAGDVTITSAALIDGSGGNVTLITDDGLMLSSDGENYWTMRGIGSHGGTGGGGAPIDAQYLVLEGNSTLTNERVLQAGDGIEFEETGGSPGTALKIHATGVAAKFFVSEASNDLPNELVLSAGANIEFSDVGGSPATGVQVNAPGLSAPFYLAGPYSGLSGARTLVAGNGVTFTDGGGSPPTTTTIAVSSSVAAKVVQFACSDLATALNVGTDKAVFRMPYAMTLTEVRASLYVADTGSPTGGITIDINMNGTSVLSTKLTIDAGEKTSTTAATAAVISTSALTDDAEITVDIDACGGNSKGLVVTLIGS